jgi:hypothetical protein
MDKSRWHFIRTERILESIEQHQIEELEEGVRSLIEEIESELGILEEAPLKDLERNIVKGFPTTRKRQYATDTIRIDQLNIVPYVNSRNLLFKGVANNQGRTYDPEIYFEGIEFDDEDTPNNVTFIATDGERYHIQPIKFTENNAKVRCTCLDFYYRFSYYNAKAGDLYGKPFPPYRRRTTTYPPVNPMKLPGVCKHLLKMMQMLEENKFLVAFASSASTPTPSYKITTVTAPQGKEPPKPSPETPPPTGKAAEPEEPPVDQNPSPGEKKSIDDLTKRYKELRRDYENAGDIRDPAERKGMLDTILPKLKQLYSNIKQWGKKFPGWLRSKLRI